MAPRTRAAATAPAAQPASKVKPVPKSKSKKGVKRPLSDAEEDDGQEEVKKPAKKKAKAKQDEDANEQQDEKQDSEDQENDPEPTKMVTVLKRGAAPVDPASQLVLTHQVLSAQGEVWDAMLNQTNLQNNNNKFYVLQLLHPLTSPNSVSLFTRWGRVGETGAHQFKGPFDPSRAILEFKKQFKAKAAISWENRVGMVAKPGKYTWIERDFEAPDESVGEEIRPKGKEREMTPECNLHVEIQTLCKLIFSTKLFDATLSSMNYDANKLPLGKLSKKTILAGFAALKEIANIIDNPNADVSQWGSKAQACATLSGNYYSIVPHAFGRTKPVSIDNEHLLKKELELVDALGDMEIAQKLITSSSLLDAAGNPLNPLDAHFASLDLKRMDPIGKDSKEFEALNTYARETHGFTHSHVRVVVQSAFRVERIGEKEAWEKAGWDNLEIGQRLLLWHGSRTTNFAGILKQGLRIAPPEAPVTGYMFGKGVYFADAMSKSANYCYANLSGNIGLLLLCEVAVKPALELTNATYDAGEQCAAANKLATKGIGMTQPTAWQDAGSTLDHVELLGCHMPKGGIHAANPPGAYLQYNEYIVYSPSQIRLRYLLMVDMS